MDQGNAAFLVGLERCTVPRAAATKRDDCYWRTLQLPMIILRGSIAGKTTIKAIKLFQDNNIHTSVQDTLL